MTPSRSCATTTRRFDERSAVSFGCFRQNRFHARPLKTVGRRVWELKISEKAGQFRVIYVVKRRDRIYVLHAFQKKTQAIPRKDIELARTRFKEI